MAKADARILEIDLTNPSANGCDIAHISFVSALRADGTQRDRDIALISATLREVWYITHHEIQLFGKVPTRAETEILISFIEAATRQSMLHFITDGLTKSTLDYIDSLKSVER